MESIKTKDDNVKIAEYWIQGTITAPREVQCKLKQLEELQNQIVALQNQKLHILEEIIQEAKEF